MSPPEPLADPTPRAVAVVVRRDKLLVMARRVDGREYAVLPGGAIEAGETPEESAVRELAEECSLHGTAVRRLFEGDHGRRSASYVLVDAPDGEPVLGGPEAEARSEDDHYQPLWATARELPLLGLLPEGVADLVTAAVWPLRVGPVGRDAPDVSAEWLLVERLWQLYEHDLAEFRHSSPGPDGLFQDRRLTAFAADDDSVGYLARLGDLPVGFGLVSHVGGEPRLMSEFFVCRSARGGRVAFELAHDILLRHPGRWTIPFQNENPRAAAFWRRLAADLLEDVSEKTVPVPGKPHLPRDVLLSGTLAGSGPSRG